MRTGLPQPFGRSADVLSGGVQRQSIGEEGDLEHECSALAKCFIVAQMFNLQRQAPFLPMQC
jgi:hypothetical protein